ncbi:MAG: NADH-quinone oxidoreductase subunit A [Actinomycetota bacterium]|nr:NADH-quinone oxidoreductase subunit A [Actinomycetota bacterium]
MAESYLPALLFVLFAVGFAGVMLGLTMILGPKRSTVIKDEPFECGSEPIGSPRVKLSVKFYQVAILFLVFDIEVAFLYPWASLFRELSCTGPLDAAGVCTGQPSLFGLVEMLIFLGILVVGLAYIWRKKALDWA